MAKKLGRPKKGEERPTDALGNHAPNSSGMAVAGLRFAKRGGFRSRHSLQMSVNHPQRGTHWIVSTTMVTMSGATFDGPLPSNRAETNGVTRCSLSAGKLCA
jgi:hypothetical protein